ncbi:hypothetical protein LTR37_006443 [Vermiconidia calcicola]|uniref:Uncharacterized protein n=1 Tax=Vermiconidia calcicola TaxID=1690605 RepID=A0ACC3NGW9_9PEZI|nr:hypothetical protein LTR37_006443 [Vermiconidia calcicola]
MHIHDLFGLSELKQMILANLSYRDLFLACEVSQGWQRLANVEAGRRLAFEAERREAAVWHRWVEQRRRERYWIG